jgi:hypothetical protein
MVKAQRRGIIVKAASKLAANQSANGKRVREQKQKNQAAPRQVLSSGCDVTFKKDQHY